MAACRKRNIQVRAYYCTTWDNYLAENHPEWLVFKRDRTTYLAKFDATPHWTALCLAHEDFVELMLSHIKEFTSRYELDGVSLDMPVPIDGECFCSRNAFASCAPRISTRLTRVCSTNTRTPCTKPSSRRVHDTVKAARPNCQVDFNGQCVYGLGERVAFMDSLDIEALPTAFWGYYYFPTMVRYTRNFGVPTYGLTGRFADLLGGLRRAEIARPTPDGGRQHCGQLRALRYRRPNAPQRPSGPCCLSRHWQSLRTHIKSIEPYLDQAAPVTEAALLTGGLPLESPGTETELWPGEDDDRVAFAV